MERRFAKGLNKPGMAAQLRESISQVVRESTVNNKPLLVEPIDFEGFIMKNKTLIQNDPQRELLLIPSDDVSEVVLPRKYRTVWPNIPNFDTKDSSPKKTNGAISPASSPIDSPTRCKQNGINEKTGFLLTKLALESYKTSNHVIHYKYAAYSGTCHELPRNYPMEELKEEVYEIDADPDRIDEQMTRSQQDTITKQGYLLKGPDSNSDRMFAHIGSKSFKRRYCYLWQEVDGTYILELHKDDKQTEAKATIVMDFCTEIVQNPKRGRFCFELKMNEGHKAVTLAAENEKDFLDWINKLQSVILQNKIQDDKRISSLERAPPPSPTTTMFGTLKGLDQSMNPQLIKYGRETDTSISQARKEGRRRLFGSLINPTKMSFIDGIEPYQEQFGQRILLKCDSLKFRLQTPAEFDYDKLHQVEPYLTSLALYDAKAGRKISENFYFDVNHECVRDMIRFNSENSPTHNGLTNGAINGNYRGDSPIDTLKLPDEWLMYPRQAIMNITAPHPDIYLVVKIDKILQGGINNTTEPYLKAAKDPKLGAKLHKNVRTYCQKIGHYRMPFAWTARPLFRMYSSDLDTTSDFPAIYRQESNKLRDDELLKLLTDYRKPDKFSKLTVIPGWLTINIEAIKELPENCLTRSLVPLEPFPNPPRNEATFEVTEFLGTLERDIYPYTTFVNHLFVYPLALNFDGQKLFSRARNIAVTVELRDNDLDGSHPLEVIYARPGARKRFLSQWSCPVLHHNTSPTWYEEIKMKLPIHLTSQHHLLFSFYHVSCDLTKKRENANSFETPVGYAWLPLLNKGRMNTEEHCLAVAASLPNGYLSIQPLGLGKGYAGPEIQWIDNQRQIFTVYLKIDSTVLAIDQHMQNLFAHAERLLEFPKTIIPAESETCKILKAAHAMAVSSVISFLPTIFNLLFTMLVNTESDDIGLNIMRLMVNLIYLVADEANRKELLLSYVKFVFRSKTGANGKTTIHDEMCHHLPTLLHPNNTDFLIVNKFMKYSNIFFDIIAKSMAQHLISSGRIKMHRNERFPKEYEVRIESLFQVLIPALFSRNKDLPIETQTLNRSLALFVKKCLTLMDRGFVFKLIRIYMDRFSPGDHRTLQEFKFNFLQEICSHEHYVPINLPFSMSPKNRVPEIMQKFTLSDEFCRHHFLAGLLLQEVKSALNEIALVRRIALLILKEVLAKHDLDDRYQLAGQMNRIAMLYIPWLGIVLENLNRISNWYERNRTESISTHHMSSSSSYVFGRDLSHLVRDNTSSIGGSSTSTPKSRNRFTMHLDYHTQSPLRASMNLKDTNYFAAIAGQPFFIGKSSTSLNSDCTIVSSDTTGTLKNVDANDNISTSTGLKTIAHQRSISVTQPSALPRTDKFTMQETKDMLICFLFIIKHIGSEQLILWWQNCRDSELSAFFSVLDLCLLYFRYVGKKNVSLNDDTAKNAVGVKTSKSSTLPARIGAPNESTFILETGTLNYTQKENLFEETARAQQALKESNMTTEVGLIILDCIGLYTMNFKDKLAKDHVQLSKVARVYLRYLQLGQSELMSKHVFAALRAFINHFSPALFKGNSAMCGQLVYELLKCCDSRLASIRQESCAVLYLLMRSNFEFSNRKGLTRVHLQVIISVSQVIGNVIGLNNARFQESLSIINNCATSDKAMKGTGFPAEVKDLTRRVRTVLMATAQMQAHHMDPERLLELQYSLANSYASTPELRHTWLVTMARNHEQNGNFSEAASCNLHIAALMAEYLKLRGSGFVRWGAESFEKISKNIPRDEKGLKLDSGSQDSQYTEQMLLEQLKECADYLDRAERYECLGELYRLIIPIYEHRRDYFSLSQSYEHLMTGYNKVLDVNRTGKRMLGRYYRVVFFGQMYFEEDSGVEYVYKEPKLTSLSEIAERLYKQYSDKFGTDVVQMIKDSSPVDVNKLDQKIAYIQVTHVVPYFCKDELEMRQNDFEQNHDIDRFMYETPFTKCGNGAHGNVEDQWKRKTILTTNYSFPYVLKRITVKHQEAIELSPIEVAIDEMQNRISELEDVVMPPIDVKKLQLRLQGSVAVAVNAGPLAYASAFLDPSKTPTYAASKVEDLKEIFKDFVSICNTALQVNGRMISSDQHEYHSVLYENYKKLCTELSTLLNDESFLPVNEESLTAHRNSMALYSAITGTANNSSTV